MLIHRYCGIGKVAKVLMEIIRVECSSIEPPVPVPSQRLLLCFLHVLRPDFAHNLAVRHSVRHLRVPTIPIPCLLQPCEVFPLDTVARIEAAIDGMADLMQFDVK